MGSGRAVGVGAVAAVAVEVEVAVPPAVAAPPVAAAPPGAAGPPGGRRPRTQRRRSVVAVNDRRRGRMSPPARRGAWARRVEGSPAASPAAGGIHRIPAAESRIDRPLAAALTPVGVTEEVGLEVRAASPAGPAPAVRAAQEA